MFTGRKIELENLKSFYENADSKYAVVYGRAGMGKTTLLKAFAEDKNHIFFTAYATTGKHETEAFARVLGIKKKLPFGASPKEQLAVVLANIAERAEKAEDPFLLVIDHYPHFARSNGEFDGIFYEFVNNTPNIKVVMLGDSYLAMEKIFFEKKSLWKEPGVCFELKGFGYYETLEFLGNIKDPLEKSQIYGITGGIPAHLENASKNTFESIKSIFIDERQTALLPEKTMSVELRELSYYNHILSTLAKGLNRVNQISASVEKPKDVVVPYMNTLMTIGMVTKENPVTEKTNRKKTRYSIINSFDVFWFRFFVPFYEQFCEGDFERIMDLSIKPNFSKFMETVFISMCKEYLLRKSGNKELPFTIDEIGNWWTNDDENSTTEGFDLVAVGEANNEEAIIFGRCYYSDEPVGIATLKEQIDLTRQVKGRKNVFYLVFSKNGFHENTTTVAATIKNIILVSLEDIVNG